MRVQTRLLLSYLPPLAVLAVALSACLMGWFYANREMSALIRQALAMDRAICAMAAVSRDLALAEFDYTTPYPRPHHNPAKAYRSADTMLAEFEHHLETIDAQLETPAERRQLARLRQIFDEFEAFDARLRALVLSGQTARAFQLNYTESWDRYDILSKATQELVRAYTDQRQRALEEIGDRQKVLFGLTLVLAVLLLSVSGVLALSLSGRIAEPIVALKGDVERFRASGMQEPPREAPPSGLAEVDQLHLEFLTMAREIGALTQRLRQLNEQLEGQVEERTASLEAARLELEEKVEKLHALDCMRSNFVNVVSHELRTPLATIMGFAEFLEDELAGPLLPDQRMYLAQIQQAQLRLVRLVDDLLDFARLEAGTFRLARGWVDLEQVLRTEVQAMLPQAQENGIVLHLERQERPLTILVDRGRIGQVVANLLNNAIKFTPAGGSVRVRAVEQPTEVRIEIEDTGIGVPPEHHDNLFERFYQVDPSPTRQAGGVGLGLSITKAIIEAHEGQIGLESAPGRGSTFWFSLPLVTAAV